MNYKFYTFFCFFLLCATANAAEQKSKNLPLEPFRLLSSEPKRAHWKLSLNRQGENFELRLEKIGSKKSTRKTFAPEVVEELFATLNADSDPFVNWESDGDCFHKRSFSIESGTKILKICSNQKRMAKLDNFQSAAQLVLREEGKEK